VVRRALVVAALALVWTAAAHAATPQQLTVPLPDGASASCSLTLPDAGAPQAGVMLFHGLGGRHQDVEPLATNFFAPAGYATLECDARGHGAKPLCCWALAAPPVVADVQAEFSWFQQRIGTNNIGALGISLGGGTIWNAAASGVPFKALVPVITWTNLQTALAPQSFAKLGLVLLLSQAVPASLWSPVLQQAAAALTAGNTSQGSGVDWNANQSIQKLGGFSTPTLMIQGRHDFLFDIDQVIATYKLLTGPKRVYLGNFGHAPDSTTTAPDQAYFWPLAVKWFDRFLQGTQNGVDKVAFELGHDPWDGKTTTYAGPPPTKRISVNLPGSKAISGAAGKVVRSVRVTGGPHETFGDTTVTIRYSGASEWDRLVAVLCVQGNSTPISVGGVKISGASGKATIRLMNESVKIPAGKKLVLYVGPTSLIQDPADAVYIASVPSTAKVTIGKITLNLSVLKKAVSRVLSSRRATPGVTKTQIVLGGTGPLTSTESAYAPVLRGAKAYFDYVNAHGGVNGRKIVYKIEDDQFDPAQTVAKTQKLVESDNVFAIFNSVGTEHALAVRDYLNAKKVPQLFVGSGATAIGNNHAKFPWTMGLLPSFVGEGTVVGRMIAKQHPRAKIGVLYEGDEYGNELLTGLKKGLGAKAKQIVSAQSYALLATDVTQQVQTLRAAGADTFVIFALPKQAIQAFVVAGKIGWKPYEYVTSVSIDPAVMQIVKLNAPAGTGVGAQSTAFLHDPTNPTQKRSAGVQLYLQIMKTYLPSEDPKAVAHIYGMMAAYAMVDALKHAGKNPTRASVLKAATHLNETNPFLLPGLKLTTSPSDYFPLARTYQVKFQHGYWNVLGKPLQVP
jgi:ABC-type branched-subunit amino acid transport system substrate-binding protein/esterase/lipase